MARSQKARVVAVLLAVAGVITITWAVVYLDRSESPSSVPPVPFSEAAESVLTDSNDAASGEFLPLGPVLGVNSPAPPPVAFAIGPPPEGADAPDLSAPAAAVYSVLSLIEEGKTEKLAPCFVEGTSGMTSDLYPAYVGHPVGLVDVVEHENAAKVVWEAAVHTAFTRNGKQWAPGETITLTTRLVQAEGLWKLTRLHDGIEDDPQQDND